MKTETLLKNARDRIANEANWTRGAMYSLSKSSPGLDVNLADAKCFCSIGAVAAELGIPKANSQVGLSGLMFEDWLKETKQKDMLRAVKYLTAAARAISGRTYSVAFFNDVNTSSHADVLAMFDLAIKRARRRHPNGG
jgi:hypothetical protein